MDIKKYNIKKIVQEYVNLETDLTINYKAPLPEQVKKMIKIMEIILSDSKILHSIRDVSDSFINSIYEDLKPIKKNYNVHEMLIPVDVGWSFFKYGKNELYLAITFEGGKNNNDLYNIFWFKCNSDVEKVESNFIFPLIIFNLNWFGYFEDGGKVYVSIENNFKISDSYVEIESPQAERFVDNIEYISVSDILL